jgi:hypothetical protein
MCFITTAEASRVMGSEITIADEQKGSGGDGYGGTKCVYPAASVAPYLPALIISRQTIPFDNGEPSALSIDCSLPNSDSDFLGPYYIAFLKPSGCIEAENPINSANQDKVQVGIYFPGDHGGVFLSVIQNKSGTVAQVSALLKLGVQVAAAYGESLSGRTQGNLNGILNGFGSYGG